jgi:acyl-coenzyme A thioesterase PaaI-like protein
VPLLQLPHTAGCLVCGRDNRHGLKLDLNVDAETGIVAVRFTPRPEHIGFEGIVHGGVIATVLDEVMVWAATWAGRRFCVCGELTTRFRREAAVGRALEVAARVESNRPRLIVTSAEVRDAESGELIATGTAKYVPVPADRNRTFMNTLVQSSDTEEASRVLKSGT